jgi:acyl-CoA thioester hydrolase
MQLEFEVRDYECDLQGIVNNAQYLHYLEHARHKFIQTQGIDFYQLHAESKDLVVFEANYKYLKSLKPKDKFIVETSLEKTSKLRFTFLQKIYREKELMLEANVIVVCVDRNSGKPIVFNM